MEGARYGGVPTSAMGVAVAKESAAIAARVVRIVTSSGRSARREAARHTGLMKAAFGRETDEAIESARIYEEGEGRSLLWGAEAAAAAEAAKRAAEMAEADADGAQAGNVEAREVAEIAEEAAEAAEAEEATPSDGAAALRRLRLRRRRSRS